MVAGCEAPPAQVATYTQDASSGVTKLQSWYSSSTGEYASPSGWWNNANSITVLANYEKVANDNSYYSTLANTFNVTPGASGNANFINHTRDYFDDDGWWALAWIAAYDSTGNSSYLSMAETVFSNIATNGWDTTTCGGGVWWNYSKSGKNAIPNELFLDVAAKLANRTTGSTSAGYLNWAKTEWPWFKAVGLINSNNLINDGLNSSCTNNGGTEWTYNQGVILGGLVELYQADQDPTLLPQANAIVNAVLSSSLVNSSGILVESDVSGGDHPQFKGIFLRNIMALYRVAPSPAIQAFVENNANSILAHDDSTGSAFGALWQGPPDSNDATRQTSALDAIIAGIAEQGSASAGLTGAKRPGRGTDGASAFSDRSLWTEVTMSSLVARAGTARSRAALPRASSQIRR
jgi:predicted alpha-1,6-mannanase (GH76 family)